MQRYPYLITRKIAFGVAFLVYEDHRSHTTEDSLE